MVLAKRVKVLEETCDILSGCLVELARSTRLIADQYDKALCEDRPLQSKALNDECARLTEIEHSAHAASVRMERSY